MNVKEIVPIMWNNKNDLCLFGGLVFNATFDFHAVLCWFVWNTSAVGRHILTIGVSLERKITWLSTGEIFFVNIKASWSYDQFNTTTLLCQGAPSSCGLTHHFLLKMHVANQGYNSYLPVILFVYCVEHFSTKSSLMDYPLQNALAFDTFG